MPEIVAIARAAGALVMDTYVRHAHEAAPSVAKGDGSPLTEADTRSHACIVAALAARFPTVPVVSEEDAMDGAWPAAPLSGCWLVDPLDGTKEFLKRSGEFTVNIAYVEDGIPLLGVVVAPVSGHAWYAGPSGAWRDGPDGLVRLAVRTHVASEPLRIVASRDHAGEAVRALLARLPDAETVAVGSSLKFCRLAEGTADLYFRDGPTMPWDTAAAQAVLVQAGGGVFGLDGRPLRYRQLRTANAPFVAIGDCSLPWRSWMDGGMAS
ncbi:3'(2'),5'-bisphosphate nucleotidase CysQ [Gemmatimonas sp.]